MRKAIPPIRGMKDLLPEQMPYWHRLEAVIKGVFEAYDYRELRTPILEYTDLFKRGVGEVTDIVEKEMYTFSDRNDESLTLRPENTASCVRAGITHGLLHNQRQKFWYYGPMFRYEKPQKGRYRQFYQFGAEAFGFEGPAVDVELLCMTRQIFERLGLPGIRLEINSIGTQNARLAHREKLLSYFSDSRELLDEDSLRRLDTNPLRILDSKNPSLQVLINQAPRLLDYLDDESLDHFDKFQQMLVALGFEFTINPRLVRGLDYYTRTVFEWITDDLGAQSAVCAGGRYDGLVEQLGGKPMPAVGWSLGAERVVELMHLYDNARPVDTFPHAYLVVVGDQAQVRGVTLAKELRDSIPGLRLASRGGEGSYKVQFKAAVASGATHLLVLREAAPDVVGFKGLDSKDAEESLSVDLLKQKLRSNLDKHNKP